jgi:hypothetical protein
MKLLKFIKIITSHLVLYGMVSLAFILIDFVSGYTKFFYLFDTSYISPKTRNIILLVIVIVVFPLVSIFYEIERRKSGNKKLIGFIRQFISSLNQKP